MDFLQQSLVQSGLSDIVRIHVSPNSEIVAISYALSRSDWKPALNKKSVVLPQKFNTTVFVHFGELGPQ